MSADHPQPAVGAVCVLLRHDLPDGSWHVDWLLDKKGSAPIERSPESRDLIAFRLAGRVDDLTAGASLPAERLADHRRLYLDYQGKIAGNRGRVSRLNSGRILAASMMNDGRSITIDIDWKSPAGGRRQRLRLESDADQDACAKAAQWIVHCESCVESAQ